MKKNQAGVERRSYGEISEALAQWKTAAEGGDDGAAKDFLRLTSALCDSVQSWGESRPEELRRFLYDEGIDLMVRVARLRSHLNEVWADAPFLPAKPALKTLEDGVTVGVFHTIYRIRSLGKTLGYDPSYRAPEVHPAVCLILQVSDPIRWGFEPRALTPEQVSRALSLPSPTGLIKSERDAARGEWWSLARGILYYWFGEDLVGVSETYNCRSDREWALKRKFQQMFKSL